VNYLIIHHKVADFDSWKSGYDAHAMARQQVGHSSVQMAFLSFDIKKVSERVPARFAFLCAPAGL
jgi:hypothetical protein